MPPKQKTNPRNIVRELRQKFLNEDFVEFEIRGFMNNQVHEWHLSKALNWDNNRRYIQIKRHTILSPDTGNIISNDSVRRVPFQELVQQCLFMIDDQIIDNDNMIITYIQEEEAVRYNCMGAGGRPLPRCYDNLRIPAIRIATRAKWALANPYTELGRRRIMRDYRDLKSLRFGFGKKKKKRFIQTAISKMRKKGTIGSFKRWCIRNKLISARGKVTKKCILLAKKSKSLNIRRKAIFAQNIGAFEKKKRYSRFGKRVVKRNNIRNIKRNVKGRSIARNSPKRKSPAVSATAFPVGTVKVGNDGNSWVIKKTISGVKRWVKK